MTLTGMKPSPLLTKRLLIQPGSKAPGHGLGRRLARPSVYLIILMLIASGAPGQEAAAPTPGGTAAPTPDGTAMPSAGPAAAPAEGATALPMDALQALTEACQRVYYGDYANARPLAQTAAQSTDKILRGRALLLSGYCAFQLRLWSETETDLAPVGELYPALGYHALFFSAKAASEAGQTKTAAERFKALVDKSPPGDLASRALIELIRIGRANQDPDLCKFALDRLGARIVIDPDWTQEEQEFTDGWIRAKKGEIKEARNRLLGLWKRAPQSPWADQAEKLLFVNGAEALLAPGETAFVTDADRLERIRRLIEEQPDRGIDELKPFIERAKQDGNKARLVEFYKLAGQGYGNLGSGSCDRAIESYTLAQGLLAQEDLEVKYEIGNCRMRMDQNQEAIRVFEEIVAKYPNSSPYTTRALYYSARLYKIAKDYPSAEKNLTLLVNNFKWSEFFSEACWQLAWMKLLARDYQNAYLYLAQIPEETGKDADSVNARTEYWEAVALRKLGRVDEASKVEDALLARYWGTCYAYYLVAVDGKPWPHQSGAAQPISACHVSPPLEYALARELHFLGMTVESRNQLEAMEKMGVHESLFWSLASMYRSLEDYYRAQALAQRQLKSRLKSPPPAELEAWRLAYPAAFAEKVTRHAKARELDPLLVWSLMRAESLYQPGVASRVGATGLMQIMPATGRQIAAGLGEKGFATATLADPEVNIRYGTYYLKNRLTEFGNGQTDASSRLETLALALASYNAGPGRAKQWKDYAAGLSLSPQEMIEEITFKETRLYVKRILGFYLMYKMAYPSEKDYVDDAVFKIEIPEWVDLNGPKRNPSRHVVARGETLSTIAHRYHVRTSDLMAWNKLKSDTIRLGQELVVHPCLGAEANTPEPKTPAPTAPSEKSSKPDPAAEKTPPAAKPAEKPAKPDQTAKSDDVAKSDNAAKKITHTVKAGETLYAIAAKYKVRAADIKKWNQLDSDLIKPGQDLIIKK